MEKNNKKVIIIDGNALIHRSFHALPPTIKTKKGEMVNAVYGFASFLIKALREFKPGFVILTLDRKGPTFRHEEYKEYKAKRVKAPDELYEQIHYVRELAQAFAIPVFEMTGFEADDLIGTLVKTIKNDYKKIIVTGDMDTLQLVDESTRVYSMSRGMSDSVTYDSQAVENRFGILPEQIIDYKALRGDPSDNIPGVKGVGEKSAVDLLQKFKTLENIYQNIDSDDIKDRIKNLLTEHKDDAFMSKFLATIKCDVEIDFDLKKAKFGNFKKEDVVDILSKLEFKSLLPRLRDIEESSDLVEKVDKFERNKKFKYILVDTEEAFEKFLKELNKQKEFTFDTETSGLDPLVSDLLGISFSWCEGEAYYLNIREKKESNKNDDLFSYANKDKEIESHPWLEKLKAIFANEKIKKNGHNIKFDIRVLQAVGIEVNGIGFDTMIASYLLNPGTRQHNLDALTFSEIGFEKISKEDLLGKGREKQEFGEVDVEKLAIYSCEDADFTNRLVFKLKEKLEKQKLDKLFGDMEMPLVKVLSCMENNGILIDVDFLAKMSQDVSGRIEKLEKKIFELAGIIFNINSTKQLREVLYVKLAIPTEGVSKKKSGFSTSAEDLQKIKDLHPIVVLIQEHRELRKLITTYIDALPTLVNPKTNRIHTSFNQTVTATGRLSSTDPNLQNIPVRTELGREIRKAFVAQKGCKLVALDYSQIELRLAAHVSGDKKMINAFNNGADIHSATAAEINEVELADVSKQMRREAKAVNFGVLYGQGPRGLSQTADISFVRAKEFIEQYFAVYSDVKKYIDRTIETAKDKGYVETIFGRRRYLPEINSLVTMVQKGAERMAVNTPLQGSAADIIKVAMIGIYDKVIENSDDKIKMLIQVHDELIFEVKEDLLDESVFKIKNIMENVVELKVPLVVDVKMGDSWGRLVESRES